MKGRCFAQEGSSGFSLFGHFVMPDIQNVTVWTGNHFIFVCTYYWRMKSFSLSALIFFLGLVGAVSCNSVKRSSSEVNRELDTFSAKIQSQSPERAFAILDSCRTEGNLSSFSSDFLRAQIYGTLSDEPSLHQAQDLCEALLHQEIASDPVLRMRIIDLLIHSCRKAQDYTKWLFWAEEQSSLALSMGDRIRSLRAESEVGAALGKIGRPVEGVAKIDSVIRVLDGVRLFDEMDASITAMFYKIDALQKMGYDADISLIARSVLDRLEDYELHPGSYSDNSMREPKTALEREEYIGIQRALAWSYLAVAYSRLGDLSLSKQYLDLFGESSLGKTPSGWRFVLPALERVGEYDKMLQAFEAYEMQAGGDTLSVEWLDVLRGRALVAAATGSEQQSRDYWKRYAELSNMIANHRLNVNNSHYFSAMEIAWEMQNKIQSQATRNKRTALFLVLFVLLILFCNFLAWYFLKRRSRVGKETAVQPSAVFPEMPSVTQVFSSKDLSNAELFEHISSVILHEKLFCDPNFGRQTIMDRFSLSKDRASAIFSQGSQYSRVSDFINEYRLKHACELLLSKPNMSIAEVGEASGFAQYATFSRLFKEKYGMTPTDFRLQKPSGSVF